MSKQNNGNNTVQNQNNQNNGGQPAEKKEDLTMKMMSFGTRHPRLCKVGKIVGGAFIGIGSALGIYAGVDTYRRRTKKYHDIGSLDILPDPGDPVNLMDDEEPKASASEVLADEIEVTSF